MVRGRRQRPSSKSCAGVAWLYYRVGNTHCIVLVIHFLWSMKILKIKVRLVYLTPRPGLVVLVSPVSLPVWCLALELPGTQREKGEDVQGLTRSGRGKPEWNFSWDLCYLVLFAYALAHAYHIHIKFERNGFGSPYFWNNICFYDLSKVHYKHSQFISKASLSGRVRDGGAKQLLAKQLQGLNSSTPEFMNLTTGQIRCKKPKKEKSPVDEAIAEMKKISKKFLWSINDRMVLEPLSLD